MILLFDPLSLITPDLGYSFWTLLAFVLFWFIAGKFAVKPIVSSIEARNQKIEDELLSAQRAKEEFEELKSQNKDLLKEAREERQRMISDARKDIETFRAAEMAKACQGLAIRRINCCCTMPRNTSSSPSAGSKAIKNRLPTNSLQSSMCNKALSASLACASNSRKVSGMGSILLI